MNCYRLEEYYNGENTRSVTSDSVDMLRQHIERETQVVWSRSGVTDRSVVSMGHSTNGMQYTITECHG